MIKRLSLTAAALALAVTAATQPARAAAPGQPPVVTIETTPRATELPDLDYSLLPRPSESLPGNAALKYYIALQLFTKPAKPDETFNEIPHYDDTVQKLLDQPLHEIDEPTANKIVEFQRASMKVLREGARMESVDWGPDIRHDGISTLLPYLGQIRSVANIHTIALRLDIKNHRWSDAHDKLQTGYALAHHLLQGQTLIDNLVGIAIAERMNASVEDWIREGGPNLYWPLTNLPPNFGSIRKGLTYERAICAFNFPGWQDMEDGKCTREQWFDFSGRLFSFMLSEEQYPFKAQMNGLGLGLLEYPHAKKFLVDRGMSPDEVEKLPVSAVLGKATARSYDESADALFKFLTLPYPLAKAGTDKVDRQIQSQWSGLDILARTLLPSLGRAAFISARLDRHIALLRNAEALRAHAASHPALPASLDQLDLPVAEDPTTLKPFGYSLDNRTATLTSTLPEEPKNGAVLVITIQSR